MKNIGFSNEEIDSVLDIVVAILLLGNLTFQKYSKPGVGDISVISGETQYLVKDISKYLRIEPDALVRSLTTKVQVIGKDVISTPLTDKEAESTRDAMAKTVYGRLFNWLV